MNTVNQLFTSLKKIKLNLYKGVRILNDEILKCYQALRTRKNVGLALFAIDIRRARQQLDKESLLL